MRVSLIAAMDENRVIGRENRLPWDLPDDLRRFRRLTMGKPVVMGRRTFESIGKPLPGRKNIVVTRNRAFRAPGCTVAHSLAAALEAAGGHDELMVIGGASFYAQLMARAGRLYLTLIHRAFPGDVYFPEIDMSQWQERERHEFAAQGDAGYAHTFIVLDRRQGR